MVGVGIIVPVLPELLEQLTGGSVAQAAVIGGYLVFAYAFMQFVFSPVLGNLSDRFGRRPVLLASLLGLTFDYLMMSIAPFVWYLFIGRIIAGIAGAAVATATAYMADITPPHKRTHRFGLIGAAFGLGFIIGPVIGGELGELGPRVPFYAAAGLAFANFLFGLFVLPESLPKANRRKFDIRRANPFGAVLALRKYPVISWLLGVLFMFALAAQAYPSVYNYFTIEVFHFTSSQIGRSLGAFGIGFAICQAFLVGPIVKRVGRNAGGHLRPAGRRRRLYRHRLHQHHVLALYLHLHRRHERPCRPRHQWRAVPPGARQCPGRIAGRGQCRQFPGHHYRPARRHADLFLFHLCAPTRPAISPAPPSSAPASCWSSAVVLFAFTAIRFGLTHRPSIANKPIVPDMAPPGQIRVPHIDEDADNPDADSPRH